MPDASASIALRVALVPTVKSSRDGADVRVDGPWLWRASRTPDGPATARFSSDGGVVTVDAWGPGAAAAVAAAPDLLGAGDDPESFRPDHPRLRAVVAEHRWVRMARAGDFVSCLVRAVCGQRVTWRDAEIAWRGLLRRWGTEAPGPAPEGLRVPPDPEVLRRVPLHELHTVEMEAQRGRALLAVCAVSGRINSWTDPADALSRVQHLPGIGPWTATGAARRAFGDPDLVLLGDLHAPRALQYALTGDEGPADDASMLALLAPYAGHRGRVQMLIDLAGLAPPRHAPLPGNAHRRRGG